ncbi:MAG TPA: MarR family transcriptional regulator [Gammaproteobacteria bacterium]|nr:MarR family transcriptional regulator [Gammaproteobacteria bacterium]
MTGPKRPFTNREPSRDKAATHRPGDTDGALDQSRLERNLGFHVARAHARLRRQLLARLGQCELTLAEYSLLAIIEANDGVMQGQAAEALEIAPPNMAHLVQRMLQRRFITRARSPRDGRARTLSLTAAGRTRLARAEALAGEQEARLAALFSARERTLLRALLTRIRNM